ncbi:hypothetical protein B0H10DRAFT_1963996 [Mycena sp. CBHHK59/15]|nr:hypothetical protein B0H10DRAFT_1972913 [Mycena sp. CBHHK59/15]KAJ6546598.1 hypothetical protein B0H10DRAFT_1969593 [Mycena sp. CBHHK59/15]KAJ6573627.1 hypothetical protein B0H10DRAFT_1963996 [Mycena sp. CBHHK59/15]
MASTFRFLFRPPYIRPDVVKLGNNGQLVACGGSDGRVNVFSLLRGTHITSISLPAAVSALTWEPTSLAETWTLWMGMTNGGVDSIPVAVEDGPQEPTPKHVLKVGEPVVQITPNKTAIMVTTASQEKILMDFSG